MDNSYTFASQLESDLNTIFSGNYYNPANLLAMTLNSDDYVTYIEIPEEESLLHLDFLVVPNLHVFQNSNVTDEVYGYFLSGSTIDSVKISEDNEEDYYLWVVDMASEPKLDWQIKPWDMMIEETTVLSPGPCNGNRYCDPGEDVLHCSDCFDTLNYKYKVMARAVISYTDEKPWLEGFLSGRYDFAAQACEHGPHGGGVEGISYLDVDWGRDELGHVKRKNICRKTKKGKLKGGAVCPSKPHEIQYDLQTLDLDFNPYNSLSVIFYEHDDAALNVAHYFYPTYGGSFTFFSRTFNGLLAKETVQFDTGHSVRYVGTPEFQLELYLVAY